MLDETDLTKLTVDQLCSLVQVRGQAIQFDRQADDRLHQKITSGEFDVDTYNQFIAAKDDILAKLATAEEKILAGTGNSATN